VRYLYHGGGTSLSGGHYTCSIKKNNEWFLLDDGRCSKKKPLLKFQKGESNLLPYLVMYRRTSESLNQLTLAEETESEVLDCFTLGDSSRSKKRLRENDGSITNISKKPRTAAERKRDSRAKLTAAEREAVRQKDRQAKADLRKNLSGEELVQVRE
jgi:hypothetical protein